MLCARCGQPLGRLRERRARPQALSSTLGLAPTSLAREHLGAVWSPSWVGEEEERVLGLPASIFHLALGLALAQVFTLGSCSWFAWFLSSLVHEMGHSAASLLTGAPAFPVIRLDGHAMAISGAFSHSLAVGVWILLGGLAWRVRSVAAYCWPLVGLIALGAATTWSGGREALVLFMGHGGELVFAGLCFVRCLSGRAQERSEIGCVLYAVFGWYLVLSNASLFFGLATSDAALVDYYGSGSFGLANDFERLARDVFDCKIRQLAVWMVLACIAVLPTSLAAMRWRGARVRGPRAEVGS